MAKAIQKFASKLAYYSLIKNTKNTTSATHTKIEWRRKRDGY
jgi:hypothetical protein